MGNPKKLSELLAGGGKKLAALKVRSMDRSSVVEQIRAGLPPRLAEAVASAGLEQGRLTIGVTGAVWASRLRYMTESIRKRMVAQGGVAVVSVRVRVVPPGTGLTPKY